MNPNQKEGENVLKTHEQTPLTSPAKCGATAVPSVYTGLTPKGEIRCFFSNGMAEALSCVDVRAHYSSEQFDRLQRELAEAKENFNAQAKSLKADVSQRDQYRDLARGFADCHRTTIKGNLLYIPSDPLLTRYHQLENE